MQNIQGLDDAQSLSDLAGAIPTVISTFLGYSVIPQVLSESQLTGQPFFNTTNRLKQGNSVNGVPILQSVSFKTVNGVTEVRSASCIFNAYHLVGAVLATAPLTNTHKFSDRLSFLGPYVLQD